LQLPNALKEMNIGKDKLPLLARDAMMQTRLLVTNPKEVCYEDALAIYQAAYGE
jgi:alcohol dehydrogenase